MEYAQNKRKQFIKDCEKYTFSFHPFSEEEKIIKKLEILKLLQEGKFDKLQESIKDSFTNCSCFCSNNMEEVIIELRDKNLLEISFVSYSINLEKKLYGEIVENILILYGTPKITAEGIKYIHEHS